MGRRLTAILAMAVFVIFLERSCVADDAQTADALHEAHWQVRDVWRDSPFVQAGPEGAVAGLDLQIHAQTAHDGGVSTYSGTVTDLTGSDRAVTLAFAVPVDAAGWTWWDDPESSRLIEGDRPFQNLTEGYYGALLMASRYPIAVIGNETWALCLAVPPHPARGVRFLYDPSARSLRAEFDFGLSTDTLRFPSRADATVLAFEVPPELPFRQALDAYYALYRDHFRRRAGRGGGLLRGASLAPIASPDDFQFAWHDFAIEFAPVEDWSRLDRKFGIESYLYREPQTNWRYLQGAPETTVRIGFDKSDAGFYETAGNVRFANGACTLGPGAELRISNELLSPNRAIECEFTIRNVDSLHGEDSFSVGWAGDVFCGIRKTVTDTSARTGIFVASQGGVGASLAMDDAQTGHATIRLAIQPFDGRMRAYAAFGDDARNEDCPPVLLPVASLPAALLDGVTAQPLAIRNDSAIAIDIDDVIVRLRKTPGPASYDAYLSELKADADNGDGQAQATLVSGAFDADGRYNLYLDGVAWTAAAPFGINATPAARGDGYENWPDKFAVENRLLAPLLGWSRQTSLFDGVYFDSMQGWGNLRNYRRAHWKTTEYPLTFDRTNDNAICLQNIWGNVSCARALSESLHAHNQKLMGNDVYHQVWYHMPFVDIAGRELSNYVDGAWSPPDDATYLYWRAMSGRRPFWTLMNDRYDEDGDPEIRAHIEEYFQRSLFYGVFPGMYHAHDGRSPWYWGTPEFYDRDRPLFKKYMPMIQRLDLAGWHPLPCANVRPAGVRIERFGSGTGNDLAYTLHNTTGRETAVVLDVNLEDVDATTITGAREWIHELPVAIKANNRTASLSLTLPSRAYAALALEVANTGAPSP